MAAIIIHIFVSRLYIWKWTLQIYSNNKTIATATRETIDTIYATADKLSIITAITFAFITITITIATINVKTGTTTVININSNDTGADVSELAEFDLLLLTGVIVEIEIITIIQIIMASNTPLDGSKLAEWVGFNKIKW